MNSKESILKSIREHTQVRYEMPLSDHEVPTTYADRTAQFLSAMRQAGGKVLLAEKGTDINRIIREMYPDVRRIASVLPEITVATFNPDNTENVTELDGTDLAIVRGNLGVAENAAVWMKQDIKHRVLYFIAESLIILLDRNRIVNNMAEAYRIADTGPYGYGTFISGPSKTADIEQALVLGAHGAKEVTVILTDA